MIESAQSVVINAAITQVWDYVQDIRRWANLFPGCRECTVLDEHNSQWVIKVGAGGMVRTVNVRVHIDQWDGPGRVDFSYQLDNEPVIGGGSYIAVSKGANETEITLNVRVEGSGPMAPMWEAMSRPLLPQLAKSFAGKLKIEIEQAAGIVSPVESTPPSVFIAMAVWFQTRWRTLFGLKPKAVSKTTSVTNDGEIVASEQNKAVVLKFIEAMGVSDGITAASCLTPEAFTLAKGFGKFAGVRHYDTIIGTVDAFKKLLPTGLCPDIKSVTAEHDRVCVEFEGNATTCEGKPYNNQYCMVFTLTDGKIKQVNEYFCTLLADQVLWPLVEQMAAEIPQSRAL